MRATDPAPTHVVIGLYTDQPFYTFVMHILGFCRLVLRDAHFQFALKDAVQERGLLVPAELDALTQAGQAAHQRMLAYLIAHPGQTPDRNRRAEDDPFQWALTLPQVLLIATAADFMATAHLTEFGEEARRAQVEMQHVPAAEYDDHVRGMLHALQRFQEQWRENFGHFPSYRARLAALEELRGEFVR